MGKQMLKVNGYGYNSNDFIVDSVDVWCWGSVGISSLLLAQGIGSIIPCFKHLLSTWPFYLLIVSSVATLWRLTTQ